MAKAPTKKQRSRWERIRELGCSVCKGIAEIHHALTGMGGRKDHDLVFALCNFHHTGLRGIHKMGRRAWQATYGTELEHLAKVNGI